MTGRDWAYLSNDLIYVALFAYAFSFLGYAFATAFSVKPGGIDRSTTKRSNRIATIFFIIATAALALGVIARGLSATRVPKI